MKVLVAAASRHGSTAEIADKIADTLRERGFEVDRTKPEDVSSLDGYDAIVVGSPIYFRQWDSHANEFLRNFYPQLKDMPVWAFSSGLSSVERPVSYDKRRIGPAQTAVPLRHHATFPGRYKPSLLSLRERSIARLAGAVEGDYRDWAKIEQFAANIASQLQSLEREQ